MVVSRHSYSLPLYVDEMVSNSGVGSAGAPLLLAASWVIVLLLNRGRAGSTLGRLGTAAAVDRATAGAGAAAGLLESVADVDRVGVLLVDGVNGSLIAEELVLRRRYSNKDT